MTCCLKATQCGEQAQKSQTNRQTDRQTNQTTTITRWPWQTKVAGSKWEHIEQEYFYSSQKLDNIVMFFLGNNSVIGSTYLARADS